ncbi:hypothetical protein ABB37_02127 [Leptomonas pyrrhocoris]|uniref:Uncharacterized protein n=1 Tax=Leptomonas pyrrhocoris TaxID=157538 RepID=A0A0M9G7A5_LEPPY|nr:hypothetical protein ABB37_02127 [Leptomonas pyrrhocoris]KPA83983.1 hypothetical protein ABB37_02127 [Leptomonas pyrrhocoris]|eukprot:XP_015662422.1 hypothetical protein ABB37_02127 [Leptomonas pyrrhocoris]
MLQARRGFLAPRMSPNKERADTAAAAASASAVLAGGGSITEHRSADFDYDSGSFGAAAIAAAVVPTRPLYAAMHNTIRLCQRALIALIQFCSDSDETNALRREGLPIKSRQSLFYDMRFHRLLFDVVMAPFQLLHSADAEAIYGRYSTAGNSIAAVMRSDRGTVDHIYATLRMHSSSRRILAVCGVVCGVAAAAVAA